MRACRRRNEDTDGLPDLERGQPGRGQPSPAVPFYDVEDWFGDGRGPPPREGRGLGDIMGRRLSDLQCRFGLNTLVWAEAEPR